MLLEDWSSNAIFLKGNARWVSWPALSPVLEANKGMLTTAPGHSYLEKDVNLVYIHTPLPNKMNLWGKKKTQF